MIEIITFGTPGGASGLFLGLTAQFLDFAKTKPGTSYLEILSRQISSANFPPLTNDNVLLDAHD